MEKKKGAPKSLSRRVVITVSIERHTVDCLRELALKDNMSLSRLVENFLRNVLNEYRRAKGDLKADEKIKKTVVGRGGADQQKVGGVDSKTKGGFKRDKAKGKSGKKK